jgi:malate dehydrogenase (oxaloacetate-decarboxylating)
MAKDYKEISLKAHEKLKGKIEMTNKVNPESKEDLSIYYSPGVAEPCREIVDDPENAYKYTRK